MKTFIASSEKHVGKIREDIYIRDACRKRGIQSEIATLDDIVEVAESSDIVILKSIWGYHVDPAKFLAQISLLRAKNVKMVNDYNYIDWNIDKSLYLDEIRKLNIVATKRIEIKNARTAADIRRIIIEVGREFDTDTLVIKPSISASGFLTFVYHVDKKNDRVAKELMANKNRGFIVQPYLPSIAHGEISVIIMGGTPLYGVVRFPGVLCEKRDPAYLEIMCVPISIRKNIVAMHRFFMKKFGALPDICRVDFIGNGTGYKILEIELIDPDLYFRYIPISIMNKALSVLAKAVKK